MKDVPDCPKDPVRRSAANYVDGPKKNPFLLKWSRYYSTKIPMGVREFVLTGPLLVIVLSIAYFTPQLIDVEKFTQGLTPHTQDMREYTLEPLYDEKGQLKGYRHVNRKGPSSTAASGGGAVN